MPENDIWPLNATGSFVGDCGEFVQKMNLQKVLYTLLDLTDKLGVFSAHHKRIDRFVDGFQSTDVAQSAAFNFPPQIFSEISDPGG